MGGERRWQAARGLLDVEYARGKKRDYEIADMEHWISGRTQGPSSCLSFLYKKCPFPSNDAQDDPAVYTALKALTSPS